MPIGGEILHPSIAGWLLVPIASHALSNRPIVLPDLGEVRLQIVAGRDASVNFDMQSLASLLHGAAFVLGFTVVFVTVGVVAGLAGGLVAAGKDVLTKVGGILVIVLGLHTMGLIHIPFL